jgi:TolB-like protein
MTVEVSAKVVLAQAEPFRLGPLDVRPAHREAREGEACEILEPRVMQVLVALARRAGDVVSRDELAMTCWEGRIVGEDALNRCISRLRQLGKERAAFDIATVPRVGYRLTVRSDGAGAAAAPGRDRPTIAVLPFANLSSDPEQEYFSDGLTEELISQLAQSPGLRVSGRTSAFAFKGRSEDLRVIGQKLGVGHILEGSVRKAGARLRITAELVHCADGFHLWSETFDRELNDVFAIQSEVANAVTRALGATLGLEAARPDWGGAASFEAFDEYLRAGHLWTHVEFSGIEPRIAHLRRAVAIDPGYALAWANLSMLLAYRDTLAPLEAQALPDREREEATRKAMALAPQLRAANIAAAWLLADERDWRAADERATFALSHGKGVDAHADAVGGGFLTVTGRLREGLRYRLAARDADPLSLACATLLLRSYAMLGMWPQFDAEYERSRSLEGVQTETELLQLRRLLHQGAGASAVEAQYGRALSANPPGVVRELAQAHGDQNAVREVLARRLGGRPLALFTTAQLAGAYGETELALQALSRAVPLTKTSLLQYVWAPELSQARRTPVFKALMGAAGLAQFWRESGKWPDLCRPLGEDDFEVTG